MGRMLNWPRHLRIVAWQPLTGPRTVGGGSSESVTGFVQTTAAAFGAWRWQLSLEFMRHKLFRTYRGMVVALNGGANAVRVPFSDPDGLGYAAAGVIITDKERRVGLPFSNHCPFSNGCNWFPSRPPVKVIESAAIGDNIITLDGKFWGHELVGGEWIGFFPFHFGLYVVTEVIDDGVYRVWPPLRAALDSSASYATLRPVMAMRLESESAGTASRNNIGSDSSSLTLVEIEDQDVRDYFAG